MVSAADSAVAFSRFAYVRCSCYKRSVRIGMGKEDRNQPEIFFSADCGSSEFATWFFFARVLCRLSRSTLVRMIIPRHVRAGLWAPGREAKKKSEPKRAKNLFHLVHLQKKKAKRNINKILNQSSITPQTEEKSAEKVFFSSPSSRVRRMKRSKKKILISSSSFFHPRTFCRFYAFAFFPTLRETFPRLCSSLASSAHRPPPRGERLCPEYDEEEVQVGESVGERESRGLKKWVIRKFRRRKVLLVTSATVAPTRVLKKSRSTRFPASQSINVPRWYFSLPHPIPPDMQADDDDDLCELSHDEEEAESGA